jgi:hypothetical protein
MASFPLPRGRPGRHRKVPIAPRKIRPARQERRSGDLVLMNDKEGHSHDGPAISVRSQGAAPAALEEENMKLKILIVATLMTAVAAPASAQSFYVVQDAKTKKCTITETKPTTTETTVVSGDSVYKTRTEAETGMKTIKVCSSN